MDCSVSIGPEITRAEVRVLWEHPGMHRDARGETVNYYEFLRAFSDLLGRAFPNAKRAPPRHGDADLIMRSLRLNADTDLVREELRTKVLPSEVLVLLYLNCKRKFESVRVILVYCNTFRSAQIEVNLSELEAAFEVQDPSGTGVVSASEFSRIMRQLAPDLSRWELDRLCARFALGSGERQAPHPLLTRSLAQQGPLEDHMYEYVAAISSDSEHSTDSALSWVLCTSNQVIL